MVFGPTVGVLAPFIGGPYFGPVLAGLSAAVSARGGRIIVIQTLDGGSAGADLRGEPDFRCTAAWGRVSALVAVTNAVQDEYLAAVRAIGKPVVAISHEIAGFSCPVVAPDNHGGIRAALEHLIWHGHRKIAFAGFLTITDIQERYQAYQEILREHGIEPDPALFYDTDDNQVGGGERAARQMLAAGLPSTAVLTGNDNNALGVVRGLTQAGYEVPRDQAVVGFDDIPAGRYATPSLTSLRQDPERIAQVTIDLVIRQLEGEELEPGRYTVPTTLLVRESCGCDRAEPRLAREHALFADVTTLQHAVTRQYDVSMGLLRYPDEDPSCLGWLSHTNAQAGCLGIWKDDPDVVDGPVLEITGAFARPIPGKPASPTDVGTAESALSGLVASRIEAAEFPPQELISLADWRRNEMLYVIPVRAKDRDWGLLAVIGEIEAAVQMGREAPNQWGGLLAVALHHEAVLDSLRAREEELRYAALYDKLTGLPNRRLFLDRLTQALRRAKRRPDYHFAVLFLDLDGFKVVNDSLGHAVGDRLLTQLAERIKSSLRECDTVARFGGDEFAILVDGLEDLRMPVDLAERLHQVVLHPFHLRGQDVVVTASIGIALSATRYDDAEEMLRDSDIAMYWAKALGQGSHAIFDVAMHARAVHRLQVEAELRHALDHDEFELYYQPIVRLDSGETAGFEGLVRWRHPERGLVAPAEFLPIAEESGLILPIGRKVIQAACRQLAAWRSDRRVRISVNISNRQFWDDSLLDDLDGWLLDAGIDPRRLVIEITEGVVMHNVEAAVKTLAALRDRDLHVHIDDFGTGYSSLEALHRLSIDALKIDQSFVARLGSDSRSRELVRTIVMMGRSLGLSLIAEGVETELQRDQLRELGCQYGQGYFFSRPVPASEAERLISGER